MPQKITTGGEPGKKIKPLTKYWVCVGIRDNSAYDTISYTKSNSIKLFLNSCPHGWNHYEQKGWRCIKVNITFTPA